MGTAAYMAPEQAKGRAVDRRADVWAFAAVVYEMVTGTPAFAGDNMSDVLANVIKSEPQWDALPADLSPILGSFLRCCLSKEPKQRVHDVADVRLALEGAFETTVGTSSELAVFRHVRFWQRPVGWQSLPWDLSV